MMLVAVVDSLSSAVTVNNSNDKYARDLRNGRGFIIFMLERSLARFVAFLAFVSPLITHLCATGPWVPTCTCPIFNEF